MTLPASFRGKNTTRPDYEHQNSNLYAISGQSHTLPISSVQSNYGIVDLEACRVESINKNDQINTRIFSHFKFKCRFCELNRLYDFIHPLLVLRPICWYCFNGLVSPAAMDGVPFMISEKFACASSDVSCILFPSSSLFGADLRRKAQDCRERTLTFWPLPRPAAASGSDGHHHQVDGWDRKRGESGAPAQSRASGKCTRSKQAALLWLIIQ